MIRGRAIEKRYGRKRVLTGVDVAVPVGGFALVTGPNGSGKTTLLRMVAGLAAPSRGDLVVGADRSQVGYLAHEPLVYRELTALENLDLFGRLYRVPERRERIGMLLERFGLWDARSERVSAYSRGMTQRLGLARVLLHDPQVLLLDEPASGLDPRARIEIRALLKELRLMGKTILVSSHILPELADICNKIGIIEQGVLLVNGAVVDVMKQVRTDIVLNIAVSDRLTDAANLLENQPEVESVQDKNGVLIVKMNEGVVQYSFLAQRLLEQGYDLTLFKEDEINLETAFMHLTKGITS